MITFNDYLTILGSENLLSATIIRERDSFSSSRKRDKQQFVLQFAMTRRTCKTLLVAAHDRFMKCPFAHYFDDYVQIFHFYECARLTSGISDGN